GGLSSRAREEKQAAAYGGDICRDATAQDEACNAQPCPVDCEWGTWTDFDACTTTCGGGKSKRERIVWVAPAHGGAECEGSAVDEELCNKHPCPEDCHWSDWSAFTDCSQTCGGGTTSRTRTVVKEAHDSGAPCLGDAKEEQPCGTSECPADCQWDEWSPWTGCTRTCDGGVMTRQRDILEPGHDGGLDCHGESSQQAVCGSVQCPVDCVVTDWSPWSGCSATCDGGVIMRFRIESVEAA
ncbi:unnamed protein product, partial [Effrenium voratum]